MQPAEQAALLLQGHAVGEPVGSLRLFRSGQPLGGPPQPADDRERAAAAGQVGRVEPASGLPAFGLAPQACPGTGGPSLRQQCCCCSLAAAHVLCACCEQTCRSEPGRPGASAKPRSGCRARHADVLEFILFLNANADVLYSLVWGDKDLYELAFALAGRLGNFTQAGAAPGPCSPPVGEPAAHLHPARVLRVSRVPAGMQLCTATDQVWDAQALAAAQPASWALEGPGAPQAADCRWLCRRSTGQPRHLCRHPARPRPASPTRHDLLAFGSPALQAEGSHAHPTRAPDGWRLAACQRRSGRSAEAASPAAGRLKQAVGRQAEHYGHAAMVQLDPAGLMAFWHRTSGAKLNPHRLQPPWAVQAQYVTVPLRPSQAMDVHGPGLCAGGGPPCSSGS